MKIDYSDVKNFGLWSGIDKVIEHFKIYYEKGYITAKDGNAAFRHGDSYLDYVVTASGAEKHKLAKWNFLRVHGNGKLNDDDALGQKPSIETLAHVLVLNSSGKQCSVHVHSPNTVALAALFEDKGRFNPGTAHLVTVLNTKWPELFRYTKVGNIVPFLDPGSEELHNKIVHSLVSYELVPSGQDFKEQQIVRDICIMQRHGVMAIGDTFEQCMEHIVRLEHISTILLKIITASGNLESIL